MSEEKITFVEVKIGDRVVALVAKPEGLKDESVLAAALEFIRAS